VQLGARARLLIVGQAPGARVHASGVPFDDASGVRLRAWLGLEPATFYDRERVAILPMGFCYPGRGRGGDRPPRPECAPLWHHRARALLPQVELVLCVGRFAVEHELGRDPRPLMARVRTGDPASDRTIALPHPSPRNTALLQAHPWLEADLLPRLRARLAAIGLR